ncbi:MCE-family protein Mce1C [Pseudonocardia sp. Ae406_Ps2]|uniref:MCE family protein n=1 Tax=unclassified Pseudonocardia TaxID=2619320 RepID=UPI00094AE5E8|nr:MULTISPECIES: MCE family protein [unclassified Pseudonocardia]KAA1013389.1 MCE family protein [Pseudonocardia sp. EV170527-09]OLL97667.1 MCE-family protein Mce1C [Pseudonocardia sp. Ae331_Ps2]OLM04616.1 MCE-family protein Mce1C [Pseudonocardia sp. Ae406_Ps2]OLM10554.1 MCE-family protein Mce1C [Pseudonocardia sp. Ae505_Ps2]OLM26184.1 MCE-family protein Mce1C [Pseudonocardia sp. Ae706_Ps2]
MAQAGQKRPVLTAVIGIVLIAALTLAAFNYEAIFSGATRYTAEFPEAAGLQANDRVTVAGVEAGRVQKVSLDGDHVNVEFTVDDAWVGNRTTASIEIATLLGSKFLALDPRGDGEQNPDEPIGRDRTKSPFDVVDAFNGLSGTIDQLDTTQLASSLTTLSDTFRDTPPEIRGALDGLSRLSNTISSRDGELKKLLANTRQLSTTLADRRGDVVKLVNDGNLLLGELQRRKDAIANLLDGVQRLSIQLRGLVADNQAQLRPALETLDRVQAVLEENRDNLGEILDKEAVFIRVFGNALGNGRWFDNYLCGLLPPVVPLGGDC